MLTTRPHPRPLFSTAALAFAAMLATLSLSACGGEDAGHEDEVVLESSSSALTNSECTAKMPSSGTGTICHKTSTTTYQAISTTKSACCTHGSHAYDYIPPVGVKVCNACMPLAFQCNSTLKCCNGLTCSNGKCVSAPTCKPAGTACSTSQVPNGCCSGVCQLPTTGSTQTVCM